MQLSVSEGPEDPMEKFSTLIPPWYDSELTIESKNGSKNKEVIDTVIVSH